MAASDNVGVSSVVFSRWDKVNQQLVVIGTDFSPPYQASVDVNALSMGWNSFGALAKDASGNILEPLIAIYRQMPNPSITLDPPEGPAGTEVTVQGSGWIAGDTVIIHFASTDREVAKATVGDDGSFVTTFTVPADAPIGEQKIIAGNVYLKWQKDAIFKVKEKLSSQSSVRLDLTEGPAGTKVIATGTNWRAGEHIRVTWENNRQLAVDTIVNDRGEFSVMFTVPTDAPVGARTIYFTALESRYFLTALFTVSDAKPIPLPEIDYFALGDSIASGHGLMDDESRCRRSDKAYPYQVRNYLQKSFKVNFPPKHHLACSGATVWEPSPEALKQHRYKWFKNQVIEVLDHLNKNKQQGIERPTLVSITVGANDFDFAPTSLAGFSFLWRALAGQDNEFQDWVYERRNRTEKALLEMEELDTLLGYPNVIVVFTRYHHPLTNKSWVYIGMEKAHEAIISQLKFPLPFESCGHFFNVLTCQDRGQTVVDELNGVQNSVVGDMFKKWGTDRIGITPIAYTNFKGHKGPVPSLKLPPEHSRFGCGQDGPLYTETWVQYPGDPDSNASGTGDCFHPNDMGAKKFAEGVVKAVEKLKLGR